MTMTSGLHYLRAWRADPLLLNSLRSCFAFAPGDDRATGCLYAAAEDTGWPAPLASYGPALLDDLKQLTGVRFIICAFQGYRNGSGCGWHADTPFGAQAILSLGVTRTFSYRRTDGSSLIDLHLQHGDLIVMPDGFQREWEHRVPDENVPGERIAMVFRVPAREDGR